MASSSKEKEFHELYDIKEKLGQGNFGVVHRCLEKNTQKQFAVKIMETKKMDELSILHEIGICQRLDHRNIVNLVEFYFQNDVYHLVFEMAQGGELFVDIIRRRHYTEFDACHCIEQILNGVAYLHKNNIIHRDLKCNNILLTDNTEDAVVKIADFGAAGLFPEGKGFHYVGKVRSYYMAPELLSGLVAKSKIDLWSCGILLYLMLVGRPPFNGNVRWLLDQMERRMYRFPGDGKGNAICKDAKDLIDKLLDPNESTRLSAPDALQHPFIRERTTVTSRFHRQRTIEEMKRNKAEIQNKLKNAITAAMFRRAREKPTDDCNCPAIAFKPGKRIEGQSSCRSPTPTFGRSSAVDDNDGDKESLSEPQTVSDLHYDDTEEVKIPGGTRISESPEREMELDSSSDITSDDNATGEEEDAKQLGESQDDDKTDKLEKHQPVRNSDTTREGVKDPDYWQDFNSEDAVTTSDDDTSIKMDVQQGEETSVVVCEDVESVMTGVCEGVESIVTDLNTSTSSTGSSIFDIVDMWPIRRLRALIFPLYLGFRVLRRIWHSFRQNFE